MKKLTSYLLAFTVLMLSQVSFAQDSVKQSAKASKMVTHKVTKHHKMVKKTTPAKM
ncbi:hypothetical protein [uncultured Mucilaginibacter sp.]|uniref:hypothetical protein n=1 Tax=uncultured Mucilaginibacter sp. TaxID=797541 RepID=UPI002627384B|nr:hypothetical protein [uncultured Mucilaginibacter sp.]